MLLRHRKKKQKQRETTEGKTSKALSHQDMNNRGSQSQHLLFRSMLSNPRRMHALMISSSHTFSSSSLLSGSDLSITSRLFAQQLRSNDSIELDKDKLTTSVLKNSHPMKSCLPSPQGHSSLDKYLTV